MALIDSTYIFFYLSVSRVETCPLSISSNSIALDWHVWTINAYNLFEPCFEFQYVSLFAVLECNRGTIGTQTTTVKGEWTKMQIHAHVCKWCLVWLIPNIVEPLINRSGVNKMHTKQLFTNLSLRDILNRPTIMWHHLNIRDTNKMTSATVTLIQPRSQYTLVTESQLSIDHHVSYN